MIKRTMQYVASVLAAALLVCAMGCGSASNNDQGVSFALLGVNPSDGDGELPLGSTDDVGAAGLRGVYSLQNNLSGQGIRVQRVFLRYFVEGGSAQPPSTSLPLSVVLGPAGGDGDEDGGGESSLPDGFGGPSSAEVSGFIVPPDIYTWVSLNRNSLPEPPFLMTVEAVASGITTAGDRLETNPIATGVTFVPEVIIEPDSDLDGDEEEDTEE